MDMLNLTSLEVKEKFKVKSNFEQMNSNNNNSNYFNGLPKSNFEEFRENFQEESEIDFSDIEEDSYNLKGIENICNYSRNLTYTPNNLKKVEDFHKCFNLLDFNEENVFFEEKKSNEGFLSTRSSKKILLKNKNLLPIILKKINCEFSNYNILIRKFFEQNKEEKIKLYNILLLEKIQCEIIRSILQLKNYDIEIEEVNFIEENIVKIKPFNHKIIIQIFFEYFKKSIKNKEKKISPPFNVISNFILDYLIINFLIVNNCQNAIFLLSDYIIYKENPLLNKYECFQGINNIKALLNENEIEDQENFNKNYPNELSCKSPRNNIEENGEIANNEKISDTQSSGKNCS